MPTEFRGSFYKFVTSLSQRCFEADSLFIKDPSRHQDTHCVWAVPVLFTSWHRRCGDGEEAGVEEPGVVWRDLLALLETHARQLGQAAGVRDHGVVAHLDRDS